MRRFHKLAATALLMVLPLSRASLAGAAALWTALDTPRWAGPVMVEDSKRSRLIVLSLDRIGEIWTAPVDGATQWTRQPTLGGGPAGVLRKVAGMVYDPARDQMIVIGLTGPNGATSPATFVLTLANSTWSTIDTPPAVSFEGEDCGVAFDPTRERVLTFGGIVPQAASSHPFEALLNDTWSLELAGVPNWHRVTTSGTPPLPRRDCSAVYDAATDRLIVFGGMAYNASGAGPYPVDETWALSFGTAPPAWSFLAPSGPIPSARGQHAAAIDPAGRRMLVFGGAPDNATWSLDLDAPGAAWTNLLPASAPPVTVAPAAVFDSLGDRLLVSGGAVSGAAQHELLELDLSGVIAWHTQIPDRPGPPTGDIAFAVVDSLRDRLLVVVSAGRDQSPVWSRALSRADDWQLLGSLSPGVDPVDRFAVLDPEGDRLVVFEGRGGETIDTVRANAWTWDLSTAPNLVRLPRLGNPPGPRNGAYGTVDRAGHRMLVFGGWYADSVRRMAPPDVWALSLDAAPTWSKLATTGAGPPPRLLHATVVDPVTNQFLVMGGTSNLTVSPRNGAAPRVIPDSVTPPVWELALSSLQWSTPGVTGDAPSPYELLPVADPAHGRVLVFCPNATIPNLASFDPAAAHWSALSALFGSPPTGYRGAFTRDPARDRELLMIPPGLWALSPDGSASPSVELVDAHLDVTTEVLHWVSRDHSVRQAVMQVRVNGGTWQDAMDLAPANATDFEATWSVATPGFYEFRLAVATDAGPVYFGGASVRINAVPPFDPGVATLRSLTNPSNRALTVQYFVRVAEYDPNAKLELFDLSGRRLASRTIGYVGGAWQTIDLGAGLQLRPGMYIVRLAQRGIGELRTRVVVL